MVRRFLSLAGVLLALAGIGAFVLVGIKVWHVKAEANRQARYLAAKANEAGDAADHAIGFVRDVIGNAKAQLTVVRLHPPDRPVASVSPFLQLTALQASRELVGSVERAQGAVLAATDAVRVAEDALAVAGRDPELNELFGINPDDLKASHSALASVAIELRQARGILGVTPGVEILSPEELKAVNAALDRASRIVDTVSNVVTTARGRVNAAKVQVDRWAAWLAWGTSAMAIVGGLGQLFLLRFCVRKLMLLPA